MFFFFFLFVWQEFEEFEMLKKTIITLYLYSYFNRRIIVIGHFIKIH